MKSIRNRYSRSLEGINAQGFFSPTGANSGVAASSTTLETFLATGSEGDIGVFNAATNVAVNIASALVAGTKYYVAQIVDTKINKSVTFDGGDVELTATAFDAPVLQQSVIGSDGTNGDLNIDIAGGLQEFVARVNELTPSNQPFPTTEGRAVVRNSAGVDDYDIADKIVKDLNAVFDYEDNSDETGFIAEVLMAGASTAFVPAVTTEGVHYAGQTGIDVNDASGVTVGDYITFGAVGSTDDPTFEVTEITGNRLIINRPLSETIASATAVTEKAYVAGTTSVGIRILATAEDVVFSIGVSEDLSAADITAITNWKQGSGAPWQVAAMEKEAQVMAGDTVQNVAFAEDYGQPTSFVDEDADPSVATNQYDLLFLKYLNNTDSMAYPNEKYASFGYVVFGTIGLPTVLGETF